jgi:hypothetical protein
MKFLPRLAISCALVAFIIWYLGWTLAIFPLTPTLSRRERELSACFEKCLSPLPQGEG